MGSTEDLRSIIQYVRRTNGKGKEEERQVSNIICARCRRSLKCVENGAVARWNRRWCKRGDMFECPVCKAQILILDKGTKGDVDEADITHDTIIEMEER